MGEDETKPDANNDRTFRERHTPLAGGTARNCSDERTVLEASWDSRSLSWAFAYAS